MMTKYMHCFPIWIMLSLVTVSRSSDSYLSASDGKNTNNVVIKFLEKIMDSCAIKIIGNYNKKDDEYNQDEVEPYMFLINRQESSYPKIITSSIQHDKVSKQKLPLLSHTVIKQQIPIGVVTKYTTCHVDIFLLFDKINTGPTNLLDDEKMNLFYYLQINVILNQSPDLLIFITKTSLSLGERLDILHQVGFIFGFHGVSLEIHSINRNEEMMIEVNLICSAREVSGVAVELKEIPKNMIQKINDNKIIQNLNWIWNSEHKQRHGMLVYTYVNEYPYLALQELSNCKSCTSKPFLIPFESYEEPPLELRASECTQYEITASFNFSWINFRSLRGGPSNHNLIRKFGILDVGEIFEHTSTKAYSDRMINIIRLDNRPWQFLILFDVEYISDINMAALFTSMDLYTWIYTILTIIVLSFSFLFLSNPNHTYISRLKKLGEFMIALVGFTKCFIGLFGNLFGQSLTIPRNTKKHVLFIFGLWILATIVITNGYSGILSSLMLKQTLPYYPKSLQEIAVDNFPIYSLSYHGTYTTSIGGYKRVPLKLQIGYESNCIHCKQIQASVIYLLSSSSDKLNDPYSTFEQFRVSMLQGKSLTTSHDNTTIILPNNFALVEAGEWLVYKHLIYYTLQSSKVMVKQFNAAPFTFIKRIVLSANYIYKLVARHVVSLIESGIYSKWEDLNEKSSEIYVKWYVRTQGISSSERFADRLYAPVLFQLPQPPSQPEPLRLHLLQLPLYVFCTCIASSILVFIIEIVIADLVSNEYNLNFVVRVVWLSRLLLIKVTCKKYLLTCVNTSSRLLNCIKLKLKSYWMKVILLLVMIVRNDFMKP